jgi:hypothetical protein
MRLPLIEDHLTRFGRNLAHHFRIAFDVWSISSRLSRLIVRKRIGELSWVKHRIECYR